LTTAKRNFIESIWDFFCSLKLALSLLIVLALISIIGTIIPQEPNVPSQYIASIGPTKLSIYKTLGFFHMYHSWWFMSLLGLLTFNIICCSVKRLPRVWKIVAEPTLIMDEGLQKTLQQTFERKMTGEAKEKLRGFLKSEIGEPKVTEQDGATYFFVQKHAWCRFGVYVVHLSIVIIFVGALIGSIFGFKGVMQIPEGMASDTIYSTVTGNPKELPFGLFLDSFSVSFYDTGMPKEYKSILTVVDENGQPVKGYEHIPVIVNKPLTYKGITFYQSNYGQTGEGSTFHFDVAKKGSQDFAHIDAKMGSKTKLPDGSMLEIVDSTEDISSSSSGQFSGPAVLVRVTEAGKSPDQFVVMKNYPEVQQQQQGDIVIHYVGSGTKYYTGLQVAKDPGVWVVWFGCFLMVVGIIMAFFLSHKRVWIRFANGRVVMGGTANKNPAAFEVKFESMVEKLKNL